LISSRFCSCRTVDAATVASSRPTRSEITGMAFVNALCYSISCF
jgi:hypothetical protein